MSEDAAETPKFDARRLIAEIKAGDGEALAQAYRLTFHTELGRLVLAHHLNACGIGQIEGPGGSNDNRNYAAGFRDAALTLASHAGFGPEAIAVAIIADELTEDHGHAEPESTEFVFVPDPDDDLGG